jgi:hypothetical protein
MNPYVYFHLLLELSTTLHVQDGYKNSRLYQNMNLKLFILKILMQNTQTLINESFFY